MARIRYANPNPKMLVWARREAGITPETAARRIGLGKSRAGTPAERLLQFERGVARPTQAMVQAMCRVYRRPVEVLFLKHPPVSSNRVQDFRTMSKSITEEEAGKLKALLRDISARQDYLSFVLQDNDIRPPLAFVGTASPQDSIAQVVGKLIALLELESEATFWKSIASPGQLFRELRRRVEAAGVFVLLANDANAPDLKLSEQVFRGFAISDPYAPFIVINGADATQALSFTLIHELTHVLLGSSAVSNVPSNRCATTTPTQTERFCNDVAAEFLVPTKLLSPITPVSTTTEAEQAINAIVRARHVSKAMACYQLLRNDLISTKLYETIIQELRHQYFERRALQKSENANVKALTGPSPVKVRRHRIGQPLLSTVDSLLADDVITFTKAALLLGTTPGRVTWLLGQST